MSILELHHASVIVNNLERSRRFYETVLGLVPRADRPGNPAEGIWYDAGCGQIHLIVAADAALGADPSAYPGRQRHIALRADDLEALSARLDAAGIPFTASRSGRPVLFCRDPDGNVFELMGQSPVPEALASRLP